MLTQAQLNHVNGLILKQASKLSYTVASVAPQTENVLFSSTSLVVWSGASDSTIYQDASVNWAFRALHDDLHLKTGLGFTVDEEIEMGRIQASQYESDFMRELIYCEVALQATHFRDTGTFVSNQVEFTVKHLQKMGLLK